METLFELTFQDQTLTPQVGTFTDASQTAGTFTLEDGEYYLTNADTKGFYAYKPIALQSGPVDDSKVIIEFDLKVVTASANTHTIIGTYAGVDGSGIPTDAKITLQYAAGDIELVLGSGTTETLIAAADVVVDQWYHFRIDCTLTALLESTYKVKVDGTLVTTVTGATTDYELGIIGVLGTDLHACDECGIKNITLVTETNLYVGRTALDQALQDVKGYVDTHCMDLTSMQTVAGNKTFSGTIEFTSSPGVKRTNDPFYHLTTTAYNKGSNPSSNLYSGIRFFSNPNGTAQNKITGGLDMVYYANGYNAIGLNVRNYDENSNHRFFTVALRISNDSTIPVDFVPSVNALINLGSSTAQWNNAYIKALTINGTAAGDILTHNASEFVQVSDLATDADMAEMAETWSI